MDTNHFLLLAGWIVYCFIHSALAANRVKTFLQKRLGKYFRYYRLLYTFWASISLALVLYFQYSFSSPRLINGPAIKYFSVTLLVLPGTIIMLIAIAKYFKLLSGIRTIHEAQPVVELKQDGIHNYSRHPLYFGTLLFVWGLFFIFPFLNNLVAVVVITVYVFIGIGFEEKKLLQVFGNEYLKYIAMVPRLVPSLRKILQNKKGQPYGRP